MTVTTSARSISYTLDGTTTSFTVPFPWFDDDWLSVTRDGNTLSFGADYTLVGEGEPTGTITLTSAGTAGSDLTITRVVPALQPTRFRNRGAFLADDIEQAFDRLTMLIQQTYPWVAPVYGEGVINVRSDGAAGDGLTDDTEVVLAALEAARGTGRKVLFPYGTYLLSQQLTVHQCAMVGDNAKLKFTGLSASTDCVVLQGSRAEYPLLMRGFHVDCNDVGRDGVVLAGGVTGSTQADFLKIQSVYVDNCVRDGMHFEPSAAGHWLEDFEIRNVKVKSPGRHGIAFIQPALASTFMNQGLFINCEIRGAGQTTAAYDVYVEGQGTVSGQKVSELTWINCEFDAEGAANHGIHSFYLNQTGSVSDFDGWQWVGCTFEDVPNTVPGKTFAIGIGASATVRNPQVIGGVMANYTGVIDTARVSSGRVSMSSGNINFEMLATATKLRWGNGATDTIEWESAGYLQTTASFKASLREKRTALTITANAITVVPGFNKVNLNANITSITFPTGTAAQLDGQKVRIQFTQDATGGRTVAGWPATVLLAGASFTPTATASKTSHIDFIYEQGEGRWYEVSRSLNL